MIVGVARAAGLRVPRRKGWCSQWPGVLAEVDAGAVTEVKGLQDAFATYLAGNKAEIPDMSDQEARV